MIGPPRIVLVGGYGAVGRQIAEILVLATDAAGRLDRTTAVTINLLLGLGEAHGVDAVRWTLRNLGTRCELRHPDQVRRVGAFTEPYRTTLPDEARARRFYRFDSGDHMARATARDGYAALYRYAADHGIRSHAE